MFFGFVALGPFFKLLGFNPLSIWLLSSLLAIQTNVGFGASIVVLLLNAYLPRLVASSLPFTDLGDTEKLLHATAFPHLTSLSGTLLIFFAATVTVLHTQRAGVYGCSVIRYRWLGGMVGVIFHTRSSALAGREI